MPIQNANCTASIADATSYHTRHLRSHLRMAGFVLHNHACIAAYI